MVGQSTTSKEDTMADRNLLAAQLMEIRRVLTEYSGRHAANRTTRDVLNLQLAKYPELRKG